MHATYSRGKNRGRAAVWLAASVMGLASSLFVTPTVAASSTDYTSLFGDPVLARGKGVEIKRSQLDEAYVAFRANRAARGNRISERERPVQEAQLLDRLIVTQLMINRATEGDRAAAAGLAEKFTADAKKVAVSDEAFDLQLKAMGMSPEAFDRRVMEQAISESVLEREVKSKITVPDEQIRELYETGTDLNVRLAEADVAKAATDPSFKAEDLAKARKHLEAMKKTNLARLVKPEQVKVAHILLVTQDRETGQPLPEEVQHQKRQQIEEIRQRALKGEDFFQLVKEYSEDRGVKETGGVYTLSRTDPFAPEFKAASFTLQTNQISDVVQTVYGFHIIKLLERIPSKKLAYADVEKDLKEFLIQQEFQRRLPGYFDQLKSEAKIEILDPKYKLSEAIKAATSSK